MAFPPPVQPTGFSNADPQLDTHPALHNNTNAAINDLRAEILAIESQSLSQLTWPSQVSGPTGVYVYMSGTPTRASDGDPAINSSNQIAKTGLHTIDILWTCSAPGVGYAECSVDIATSHCTNGNQNTDGVRQQFLVRGSETFFANAGEPIAPKFAWFTNAGAHPLTISCTLIIVRLNVTR